MANFGSNIIMQDAANRMQGGRDVYSMLMGIADRVREENQFDQNMNYKNRILDYKMNAPSDFNLNESVAKSLMKHSMGQELTPQEQAGINAYDMLKRSQPQFYTDEMGNRVQIDPVPLQSLIGKKGESPASSLFDIQPREEISRDQMKSVILGDIEDALPASRPDPSDMGMGGSIDYSLPTLEGAGRFAGSPKDQVARGEANVDIEKAGAMLPVKSAEKDIDVGGNVEEFRQKEQIKFDLDRTKKELESGAAAGKIEKAVNDMDRFNDALRLKNAIVNEDQSEIEKLRSMFGASYLGGLYDTVKNTESQELRNKYERARDSLIPYYISANNLPATVVDTEEFQQRILKAFGDPSLPHSTNRYALDNQRSQFGIEGNPQQRLNRDKIIQDARTAIEQGADPEMVRKRAMELLNGG